MICCPVICEHDLGLAVDEQIIMPEGWQSLYDDTDTTVTSARVGLTRTALRFVAEMKFNVLLFISLSGMNKRSDDRTRMSCEAACATDSSGNLMPCLDACRAYAERWLERLQFIDAACVDAIVLMNTLILLYICFRPSEALPYGTGKWRKSDVSLCFHINEYYSAPVVTAVRLISALGTLLLIVSDFRVSVTSARPMTLLEAWSWNANAWIPALIATANLHKPSKELASVRFRAFEAQIRSAADWDTFRWPDLLKSAPALLEAKVTAAAFAEIDAETEQQRMEAMHA